jgi:hypothetical protein
VLTLDQGLSCPFCGRGGAGGPPLTFGSTQPGAVVLAYGTGYVVTRRSLPLAGAAITEVLLTFALHWVGAPLGPALGAVVAYRLFNLILVSVPSLLANRLLHPSLAT